MNVSQQKLRKGEQQTLLCSISTLTSFCLNKCITVGQYKKLQTPQTQKCIADCSRFIIDRRLMVKDKFVKEMNSVEEKNEQIWADYLKIGWK